MRKAISAMLVLAAVTAAADAKKPKPTWRMTSSKDPITGVTSCVVAAYDRAAGLSYTRTGVLYPFVENSSVHGVLVGVSSGGRIRLPTGDVVWRVDDRPFRTLRAADNPAGTTTSAVPVDNPGMQKLVDEQMRIVAAATATSTVAHGETARAMLAEMVAGTGLIYRAAAATRAYGLPDGGERRVGQITSDGLRPIPLDESFRAGIADCGITVDLTP